MISMGAYWLTGIKLYGSCVINGTFFVEPHTFRHFKGVGRWSSQGGHNLTFVDLVSQTKLKIKS